MSPWNSDSLPSQNGRVAIVTGANSGIGFETAKQLAGEGAQVILACRSEERGLSAVERIQLADPSANVHFMRLDLADLVQVESFAQEFASRFDRLDLLINNAGVMFPPLTRTAQGHELQFGVNHLAHFALTGHLIPKLAATPGSRVVTVSSLMHRLGSIRFDDLDFVSRTYRTWPSYSQSKLANLLFAKELQRRLDVAGLDIQSLAAHPGWTHTELQRHSGFIEACTRVLAMSPEQGALPTLRAACDLDARGGEYYGPSGVGEVRGYPNKAFANAKAQDLEVAKRLWNESEKLTGVQFEWRAPVAASRVSAPN